MAQPAYLQAELCNSGHGWSTWLIYLWSCCSLER